MDSGISLSVDIKTRVRIKVLYDVIKELCCAFDFPERTLEVIHKGIVEKQILKSISADYIDDRGESVGMIRFNIDWEKHKMYAESTMGKYIEIQSDKPLIEQFALWSNDIVSYIKIMQKELNVKTIHVYYHYREEIWRDPVADKEADAFLGLSKTTEKYKYNNEKSIRFERKMKFVSQMLPELELEIRSTK